MIVLTVSSYASFTKRSSTALQNTQTRIDLTLLLVYYASFIITLFFDLSLFHMQPGIIAGDEVKYNHGCILSLSQHTFSSVGLNILTDLVM